MNMNELSTKLDNIIQSLETVGKNQQVIHNAIQESEKRTAQRIQKLEAHTSTLQNTAETLMNLYNTNKDQIEGVVDSVLGQLQSSGIDPNILSELQDEGE